MKTCSASRTLCLGLVGVCALLSVVVGFTAADEGTIDTTQTILFSGTYDVWTEKMTEANKVVAEAGINTAIQELLYRPFVTVETTVKSISALAPDPSFKSIGNGDGGLLATVSITETVSANAVHPYDASEINSLLFGLQVSALTDIYGSAVTVQTVRDDQDYKLQCTSLCKGMIATGVILGTLMLAFFVILVVYSCCPSVFSKKPKEDSA